MRASYWIATVVVLAAVASCSEKREKGKRGDGGPPATAPKSGKAQVNCPVMGGSVDRAMYVDHEGRRIYVCCGDCRSIVRNDPGKFLRRLIESGVELESVPAPPGIGRERGP